MGRFLFFFVCVIFVTINGSWRVSGRPSSLDFVLHAKPQRIPLGYEFLGHIGFTEAIYERPSVKESPNSVNEELHTYLITPNGSVYKKRHSIQDAHNVEVNVRQLSEVATDESIDASTSGNLSCIGCGPDNRVQILNTTAYPYMTVGQLIGQLGTSSVGLECTGTLIGRRHVLTAAHCVFDINASRKMVANLNFAPALNGKYAPYGTLKWSHARILSSFMNEPRYTTKAMNYDFALITLNEESPTGFLSLKYPSENLTSERVQLTTAGYPGSKSPGTMWQSLCGSTEINYLSNSHFSGYQECGQNACSNILTHSCISSDGQSGSAMWDDSYSIRSILTGKVNVDDGDAFNVGTEINAEVYNQIATWYNEDKDDSASINYTLPLAPSGPGSLPHHQSDFVKFWTQNWHKPWFIVGFVIVVLLILGLLFLVLNSISKCFFSAAPTKSADVIFAGQPRDIGQNTVTGVVANSSMYRPQDLNHYYVNGAALSASRTA